MLQDSPAFSGFSTNDTAAAKEFYGQTLGLSVKEGMMGMLSITFANGNTVIVYPKENHEPATFTVLNFPVPNIEETVTKLTAAGVAFEKYDGDMATDENGIFRKGGPLIAWFKDPAGNILSVLEDSGPQ